MGNSYRKNYQILLQTAVCQKLKNLEEMDSFLNKCNPEKSNRGDTENLNRSTNQMEIESRKKITILEIFLLNSTKLLKGD